MSKYSTTRYEVVRRSQQGIVALTVEEGFDDLEAAKAEARKLQEGADEWGDGRSYTVIGTDDGRVVWKDGWV